LVAAAHQAYKDQILFYQVAELQALPLLVAVMVAIMEIHKVKLVVMADQAVDQDLAMVELIKVAAREQLVKVIMAVEQ
jgi:hypothetical protein